jgi:hypothetical protein
LFKSKYLIFHLPFFYLVGAEAPDYYSFSFNLSLPLRFQVLSNAMGIPDILNAFKMNRFSIPIGGSYVVGNVVGLVTFQCLTANHIPAIYIVSSSYIEAISQQHGNDYIAGNYAKLEFDNDGRLCIKNTSQSYSLTCAISYQNIHAL